MARTHKCNWPGCERQIDAHRWGCGKHWMMLPKRIRIALWASYCPGQDASKGVSVFYSRAIQAAQGFIDSLENGGDGNYGRSKLKKAKR